jgi:hypothetical protein
MSGKNAQSAPRERARKLIQNICRAACQAEAGPHFQAQKAMGKITNGKKFPEEW